MGKASTETTQPIAAPRRQSGIRYQEDILRALAMRAGRKGLPKWEAADEILRAELEPELRLLRKQ